MKTKEISEKNSYHCMELCFASEGKVTSLQNQCMSLPRVVVCEELSKPLSGKYEKIDHRLIDDPESLFPRQHHVDHAQVMVRVLVADVNCLQASEHLLLVEL